MWTNAPASDLVLARPQVEKTMRFHANILLTLEDNLVLVQKHKKQWVDQHCFAPNTTLTKAIRCFWFSDPINRHHSEKSHQKLAPNFYGPYTILKRIGLVTYKFALPSHSKMYVVFHVSCLKKVIESSCRVQTRLLELDVEGSIWLQPEAILDKHECHFRWCTIEEVLIQWKYTDLEDATWESTDIFHQFPHLQP